MKFLVKNIIKITLLILSILCLFGCDPAEALNPKNRISWDIINQTYEVVETYSHLSSDSYNINILVKTKITFARRPIENNVSFDLLFFTNNDSIIIYNSDKSKVLKVWKVSERENEGRQFFNEKYWTKKQWQEDGKNYHQWTFELLPEDIEAE